MQNPYTYSSALGTSDCPTGTFQLNASTHGMTWRDGLYRIHGYVRGDVVPTVELLPAPKHADDRPRCAEIIAEVLRTGARCRFASSLCFGDGEPVQGCDARAALRQCEAFDE